jgi:DNA-binding transcriptional LysR family regulator
VGLGPRQVPEGLDHRILAGDPLVLIVPADHALADRDVVHLADLPESHQLIQFTTGTGLRRQVEAAFARAGVEPGRHFQVGQIHDMIRLAARGIGVTVVPRSTVFGAGSLLGCNPGDALPYGARALRLADDAAVHNVCAVYDSKRLAPAAAAFLDVMERHAAKGQGEAH